MQSIHFSVRPYRNYKNEVSNEFICLCLVKDNGDVVERKSIRTSAWRNNESGCREYWKHILLTRIKDVLIRVSKASSDGTSTIVRIVSFLMMQLTMIGTVGTTSSMARMITNTSHVVRSLSTLHIGKRVVVL